MTRSRQRPSSRSDVPFPRTIGPWQVQSRRVAFENPWIQIVDHAVQHPDGSDGQYGVVRFKNRAIGILPVHEDGTIPLVGQHRFAHDSYSWELPEGGGPLDQDPLDAAKRELAEETGLRAAHWMEIAQFDVSNSVTDEQAVCFLAWDLTKGAPSPDPSEKFTYDRVSFSALRKRVFNGQIRDSLTIIMVLKAAALLEAGELPPEVATRLGG